MPDLKPVEPPRWTRITIEDSEYGAASITVNQIDLSLDSLLDRLIIPALTAKGYAGAAEYFEQDDGAGNAAVALDDVDYICGKCAEENGGVWPNGHVATFHVGECGKCHKEKSIASVGDWNWPDGKARGGRD